MQVSKDSKDLGRFGSMSDSDSEYEGEQKELDLSNVSFQYERVHLLGFSGHLPSRSDPSICQMACCMRMLHVECNSDGNKCPEGATQDCCCLQSDVVTKYKAAADIANGKPADASNMQWEFVASSCSRAQAAQQ